MKTRSILIITIVLAFVGLAIAATLTVEIPANDIPRVSEAYGSIYNLGHPANMNEVSQATQKWIIDSTKDYERRKNMALFTPTPMEMQPTPTPTPSPTPTPTPGLRAAAPAKAAAPAPKPTAKPKKK